MSYFRNANRRIETWYENFKSLHDEFMAESHSLNYKESLELAKAYSEKWKKYAAGINKLRGTKPVALETFDRIVLPKLKHKRTLLEKILMR